MEHDVTVVPRADRKMQVSVYDIDCLNVEIRAAEIYSLYSEDVSLASVHLYTSTVVVFKLFAVNDR